MVDNIKGEFSLIELILIREILADRVNYGQGVERARKMIQLYDKVDDYINMIYEENLINE